MVKKRKVENLELRLHAVIDGLGEILLTGSGHFSLAGGGNESAVRISEQKRVSVTQSKKGLTQGASISHVPVGLRKFSRVETGATSATVVRMNSRLGHSCVGERAENAGERG